MRAEGRAGGSTAGKAGSRRLREFSAFYRVSMLARESHCLHATPGTPSNGSGDDREGTLLRPVASSEVTSSEVGPCSLTSGSSRCCASGIESRAQKPMEGVDARAVAETQHRGSRTLRGARPRGRRNVEGASAPGGPCRGVARHVMRLTGSGCGAGDASSRGAYRASGTAGSASVRQKWRVGLERSPKVTPFRSPKMTPHVRGGERLFAGANTAYGCRVRATGSVPRVRPQGCMLLVLAAYRAHGDGGRGGSGSLQGRACSARRVLPTLPEAERAVCQ